MATPQERPKAPRVWQRHQGDQIRKDRHSTFRGGEFDLRGAYGRHASGRKLPLLCALLRGQSAGGLELIQPTQGRDGRKNAQKGWSARAGIARAPKGAAGAAAVAGENRF